MATLVLRAVAGELAGQEFAFRAPVVCVLGRSSGCTLRLPGDTSVSRLHCVIEAEGDSAWVRDLGSTNGTYLNGENIGRRDRGRQEADPEPAAPARQELRHGDHLRLGNHVFVVLTAEAWASDARESGAWEMGARESLSRTGPRPHGEATACRYTDVSFPPKVPAGRPTNLRVRIARARLHEHDAALDLEWPEGVESLPVTVCVAAENLAVESDPQATLMVPRDGDSSATQFRLVGGQPGPARVMLDFSQGGRAVGSVDLTVEVLDSPAESAPVSAPQGELRLRGLAPLVFFNACQTGRLGYSLTRLGSWGAELIRLGCGGFIGTHWRVTDDVALEVAREFYRLLLLRTPVAEALRRCRQKARESHPDDPTWLAYSCFADPNATVASPDSHATARQPCGGGCL